MVARHVEYRTLMVALLEKRRNLPLRFLNMINDGSFILSLLTLLVFIVNNVSEYLINRWFFYPSSGPLSGFLSWAFKFTGPIILLSTKSMTPCWVTYMGFILD